MCLLPQNMKPNIFVNGSKNIPNNIVNNIMFPPWANHKKIIPIESIG
jgi:hypothetical protein